MTLLALIRHGPTAWNEAGRIQGRMDIALSEQGRAEVARWRLPRVLRDASYFTSPLLRAVQTARDMGIEQLSFEPRLIEMSWGEWEGCTLGELRAADREGMNDIEARGLDFRTPGGESPRDVQARLAPLLREIAQNDASVVAVTHKGVIRALFAWASNWDMLARSPAKLNWSSAHLFRLAKDGTPAVERLNIGLLLGQGGDL